MLTRREILALILAFVITLPAVTTRLYASDEVQYFAWLRSIASIATRISRMSTGISSTRA